MEIDQFLLKDIRPSEKEIAVKRISSYIKRYPEKDLTPYIKRLNTKFLEQRTEDDLLGLLETELPNAQFNTAKIQFLSGKYSREYLKGNTKPFDTLIQYYINPQPSILELYNSDFRACDIQPNTVDVIVTDPPYPKQYVSLYKDLALFAEKVLKPGGSLFAMAGQSYLPEILELMKIEGLQYNWMLGYMTPGGQSPQLWQRKVNTFWKPVLWYTKGKPSNWLGDVIKSNTNDNDKRFHHWGQSISGMIDLIERVSFVGETIVDPFMGGGTTGMAALAMDRKFIGVEIEKSVYDIANERLNSSDDIHKLKQIYLNSKAQ